MSFEKLPELSFEKVALDTPEFSQKRKPVPQQQHTQHEQSPQQFQNQYNEQEMVPESEPLYQSEKAAGKARETYIPPSTTNQYAALPINESQMPPSKTQFFNSLKSPTKSEIQGHEEQLADLKKLQKIDKYIGYVLGLFSLGLATIMDGILAYVLHTFYKTKDIPAPGRQGPWAIGTELWPAFMLLAASTLTFIIDGSTLISACFFRSKRAARAESYFIKAGYVAFVVKWFIIATLYRTGKTTKDLWGWACDTRAANIQKYYVNDLNFKTLCQAQTAAWGMSMTEMILKCFLMGFIFWLSYKMKKLRKAEKAKQDAESNNYDDEPKPGLQRPPSVLFYSVIEAAKALGASGK